MASSTTTLKLPAKLKARIARLAVQSGRSPHAVMLEALEREVARAERVREFVREALASDAAVEAGGALYLAEDVHAWLQHFAKRGLPARPPLTDDIVRDTIEKTRRRPS